MSQPVRLALAAGIVWYAMGMPGVGGGGLVSPLSPYAGPLAAVHSAGAAMSPADRATLSAAMTAAGDALAADSRGLVDTTEEAQEFFVAVLEFSYVGMGKPSAKYPEVAKAISAEMERVVGTEVASIDAAKRQELVNAFHEAGRALK